ncbi:MAG TPA: hypothetical protein VM240_05110 [Verrucomicrobiae bacterium]|nr:hypothetical protein [Verrucomicrobiae bacterium]
MTHVPSAQQLGAFSAGADRACALFYEFSAPDPRTVQVALAGLAAGHGGRLRWAADEEAVLCGRVALFHRALLLHFASRDAARAFVTDEGHATAVATCTSLQVAVLGDMPRAITLVSALLARVLPHWPFDDTLADGEEPGVDVSTTMPTSQAIAAVRAHPQQASPVTMINWLKFRPQAAYRDGEPPASGREAYYRYGKVALAATHSLGAKLVYACRFRQILVGNGGDPGLGRWDEFALMQYPGRATFGRMAQLKRYRAGLHHREAGLAEWGQGLTVSRPADEFTWRR